MWVGSPAFTWRGMFSTITWGRVMTVLMTGTLSMVEVLQQKRSHLSPRFMQEVNSSKHGYSPTHYKANTNDPFPKGLMEGVCEARAFPIPLLRASKERAAVWSQWWSQDSRQNVSQLHHTAHHLTQRSGSKTASVCSRVTTCCLLTLRTVPGGARPLVTRCCDGAGGVQERLKTEKCFTVSRHSGIPTPLRQSE